MFIVDFLVLNIYEASANLQQHKPLSLEKLKAAVWKLLKMLLWFITCFTLITSKENGEILKIIVKKLELT